MMAINTIDIHPLQKGNGGGVPTKSVKSAYPKGLGFGASPISGLSWPRTPRERKARPGAMYYVPSPEDCNGGDCTQLSGVNPSYRLTFPLSLRKTLRSPSWDTTKAIA